MSLTAGVISSVAIKANDVQLAATAASGGTGPYTQQWYRSTTNGFTPGGGNILAGKTALTLDDSTVVPGTVYYYVVRYTDTGHSNDTIDAAQFSAVVPQQLPDPNQFTEQPLLGQIDERYNYDTIPVQFGPSVSAPVFAGQLVKIISNIGDGVPKVTPITANTDDVFGVVNYNIKNKSFGPNDQVEISQDGNVVYLMATQAISRGARVAPDVLSVGGVQPIASTLDYIGIALDLASAPGQLIRVKLVCPSFVKGT